MATPAKKRITSKELKEIAGALQRDAETMLSEEELEIVRMYRQLCRWEKNGVYLTLQSLAWGNLTDKTDAMPWQKLRVLIGLNKEASHG